MYMASQRYGGMETLVKRRMLWLLDKSANLHSLIKGTLGDIHLEGRPIFFVLKRLPVLPSGGITNTRGQNTRSNHLSSGMSEWRGHHCASRSRGAGQTYVLWSLENAATCIRWPKDLGQQSFEKHF